MNVNEQNCRDSIAFDVAASIMHVTNYALMVISRMSGSSTGIERVGGGCLYDMKKTENPLAGGSCSKGEKTEVLW